VRKWGGERWERGSALFGPFINIVKYLLPVKREKKRWGPGGGITPDLGKKNKSEKLQKTVLLLAP